MSLLTHQLANLDVGTSSVLKSDIGSKLPVTTLQCLVLSECSGRREMLARAASDAGWDVLVSGEPNAGWSIVQRQLFGMAIVDLDGSESAATYRDLAEHLSTHQQRALLMVCGNEGDAMEEVWARQLGSWLYLPGVSEESDIAALCRQAVPVAEKLNGTTRRSNVA